MKLITEILYGGRVVVKYHGSAVVGDLAFWLNKSNREVNYFYELHEYISINNALEQMQFSPNTDTERLIDPSTQHSHTLRPFPMAHPPTFV